MEVAAMEGLLACNDSVAMHGDVAEENCNTQVEDLGRDNIDVLVDEGDLGDNLIIRKGSVGMVQSLQGPQHTGRQNFLVGMAAHGHDESVEGVGFESGSLTQTQWED